MREQAGRGGRGFTLVELLVALGLLTAVLAWAGQAMSSIVVSAQIQTGAQAMVDSLILARSEAVKRNSRVVVCKSVAGASCQSAAGWELGWIVFHDSNNNGELDVGEQLLHRQHALPPGLRLTGNSPVSRYISYTPYGKTKLTSGAFQAGTFTVCTKSGGRTEARQVIINNAGRARVERATLVECG